MRLDEVLLRGTLAARPTASETATATLYYATDDETLWQNVNNVWVPYAGPPGVEDGIDAQITTEDLVGKTMTFSKGVLIGYS